MKFRRATALLLAALAAPGGCAAGEPLGRLFHTPEHRAELDRRRHADSTPSAPAAKPVRLDGFFVRSGGGGTVWIDGRPQDAALAPQAIQAGVAARRLGRITPDGAGDAVPGTEAPHGRAAH